MKIIAVEVFLLHARFPIVKVSSDEGIDGWGPAAFHADRATARVAARLGTALVGRDPFRIERIWHELFRTGYRIGSTGAHLAALGGLDIALWDLKGRALGVPVHELLGGAIRDRVPVYSSLMRRGLPAPDEIDRIQQRLDAGFRAVKLHTGGLWALGEGEDNTVGLIQALRERWSERSQLELMVDVNQAYTVTDALRVGRQLELLDVTWLEEPIAPWDYAGYNRLQAALDLPVAAGEQEYNLWQFRDLMTIAGIDIAQPNISSCGGYTQGRKIAALAEAYNVPLHCHNTDPTLTTAAHLHFWATSPMCGGFQEFYGEDSHPLRDETPVLATPLRVVDGHLQVPAGPGLGVEIDEDVVRGAGEHVGP